ncbi:TCR/Tet family MFS transporter [Pseudoruegeria sp. SHC-113]|uniref:TCR/Tet family MFS transporter n=1 Tax=Pseudoruegeria sp. SHC-113 TaxID=2855439 RepID=UPI0021BB66BC|nr:TCR/Tet family MFS transporter [Pseudoruegeria sp. SHC-113]MCT8161820.1 TCR/Tet family MFS transporter [Pseudoruegeria sp. SHC-113]
MQSRLPFIFILLTLMIDAMGVGLIMPVMPDLIRDVQGGDLASAAIWGGILATAFAVMQFLFSPTLGSLSDRFGRRPVLLISLVVMCLDYVVMALAGTIWLLLLGRIIGGITAATQATAAAFIADISAPEKKAQNFGLMSAAFGMGFVLGPLIGGLLASFGPRAPFVAAAVLAGLNVVLGYFVLPETVTDRIRRPFEWRRANPFGAFKAISKLDGVRPLLLIFFLYQLAFFVYPAVWSYFTQAKFGWSAQMIGLSLASFGISMALIQGGLIRVILPRLGEYRTLLFGLLFNAFAFLLIATLPSGTAVLVLTPLTALGALAGPALQGMMSRMAEDNQQGELQGLLGSVASVAVILSPLVMTQTFSLFSREGASPYFPGAPFLLSMLLMAVCLLIALRSRPQALADAP